MVSFHTGAQGHDDLSSLFSRNLTLNPELINQQASPQTAKHGDEQSISIPPSNLAPANIMSPPLTAPIVYSISQHYHHSAHIARQPSQTEVPRHEIPRPASEPPSSEQANCETALRSQGIDPAALSPPQLQLFRMSDSPQQMRLIELWQIGPLIAAGDNPGLAWRSTTFEQEEQLARMRYEKAQQQRGMALDGATQDQAAQAQGPDGRWFTNANTSYQTSEPYMASGYEELMRREYERQSLDGRQRDDYSRATDPVYGTTPHEDWQAQMENQYGAFEQSRNQAGTADAMEIL